MKKITYTLLVSLFVFVSNVSAQESKTIIEKETFTFKKVKITDRDEGVLTMSEHKSRKNSNSELAPSARGTNTGIGETPGYLSVSLTGGANYDIPIAVPPGIDGIVPEISISYNSQGGNGLAGYGWNISGISVISRIPSSKFHDDHIDGVDFDLSDRFALDGERLILKSGIYGAGGAIYETENSSNLKITSHDVSPYGSSYGPSYFIVYYPDGSIARYGNSLDSSSHTNYAITYWENPQGVRIIYEYVKSNNSQSISKIKYGSLKDNNPINELRFNYGSRERLEQSYVHNVSIVRKNLLKSIDSYSGTDRYRSYSLYHNSDQRTILKYERLSAVTEYSGNGSKSHSSISFTYPNSESSINYNDITTDLGLINIEQRNSQVVPLDMTGNGKMDFIVYPNGKDKFWMFYNIQNGGYNHPYEVGTGYFESIFPSTLLTNQNKVQSGQGLTIVQKSGIQVKFKVYSKAPPSVGVPIGYDYTKTWDTPTYTNHISPTSSTKKVIPHEYISGDFNGDGLTDVLAIGKSYERRLCFVNNYRSSDSVRLGPENFTKGNLMPQKDDVKNNGNNDFFRPPIDDGNYSCDYYHVTYTGVHFINLRRDVPTGFANYAGNLQLQLNGDYKLYTGDFNGDGKTDLFHVTNGKLYVYSLNNTNNLVLLWEQVDAGIKITDPILLGDYNGDGKTDFISPTNNNSNLFTIFISTGTTFKNETYQQPFTYKKSIQNGSVMSGYNLVPLDVNGDGKTDIVEYNTITNNGSDGTQTIKVYNNLRINNETLTSRILFDYGGTTSKTGNLKHFPIPIFLTSNQPNKNLEFASISNQWVTNFSFTHDHREDVLLKNIVTNGVSYDIEYSNLDPSIYNNDYYTSVYQPESNQTYPFIDLEIAPSTKVVTALRRYGHLSSGIVMSEQVYAYKGAVFNAEGLGFLGFSAIARSNWHTDSSNRIFTVSKFDPSLRGAMTEEYSTANSYSFSTPTSNYINKTTYQFSSTLSPNKVFKLSMNSNFNQNLLEGTFTNTTYQYDEYNNPENISTNFLGGSRNQTAIYSNSTGNDYHIGRPLNTITSTTIGTETFNTEQQFEYLGYQLKQRKIKGNGTSFDIETYCYDTFGNIKKKTTTPNGEPSREMVFEYESTGRFIKKLIDIESLETTYEYQPDYGSWNLSKVTNPFGQETQYKYDNWDRQVKVIDYLGKESTTAYTEANNAYTVTDTADDGSGMIVEYDQLQRVSVIKEKNLFGEWISKKYEYDAFDRLIKESEPYTGNSPSQWNETSYDLYGRVTSQTLYTGRTIDISYNNLTTTVNDGVKTVTSTRNQIGTTASVTDLGGTINYTYYGNGNLKTANNNGVVVSTEQDGWGRRTKLIDPSAGTYEYEYNGFGEITKETNPKGSTIYEYSSLGRLTKKDINGDHTGMSIAYDYYYATHKSLKTIMVTSSDGNNSVYAYDYDDDIRLTSISESNPHAEFIKQFTYDDFGRIETEVYDAKLILNAKTSTKTIKNSYQNGSLKAIKDFTTNNNIWEATSINARGQVTSASIGNNMVDSKTYNPFGYLTNSSLVEGATSQVLMQLGTDFNMQKGTLNSRSNSMFSWSETFEYDNLDRLISFNDNDGVNNLTYDSFGRITSNNTVGDYNYASTSYKIESIDLNNQGDLYYQQNSLQQIKYNAFKKPFEINEDGKEKIGFQYNASMGRSHMFYGDTEDDIYQRNNRKHYSYDGSMEISYDEDLNKTLFVTYIGGDAYGAPAIWRSEDDGGTVDNNYYYLHRDYLGSILLITDGNGNAKEKRHFDAWGKAVRIIDGNNNPLNKLTFLDRGYTGHEHLQGVNLIHMNGRLYDPNLKRFLSPDNYVQDVTNTQNYNRYGYVLNNPLMYVDPSGEYGEYPPGRQPEYDYQRSLDNAVSGPQIDFRGFREWTTRNLWKPIQKMQPGKWIEGWFKKRSSDAAPVEYSNYEGLSSDPLAGSSASTQNASFSAGGTETGGLGISEGHTANLFDQIVAEREKPNFNGFWGKLNYFWSGGHVDGVHYNMNGNAIGLSPSMGIAGEMIGGLGGAKAASKIALTEGQIVQKAANYGYKHAIKYYGKIDRFSGRKAHDYTRDLLKRYEKIYGFRGFSYDKYFNHAGKGYLDVYNRLTKNIYDFKFGQYGWSKGQLEKYTNAFDGFIINLIRPK